VTGRTLTPTGFADGRIVRCVDVDAFHEGACAQVAGEDSIRRRETENTQKNDGEYFVNTCLHGRYK